MAIAAFGVSNAGVPTQELPLPLPQEHHVNISYREGIPSAARTATLGAAPSSLLGKKYITIYNSFTNYGQRCGSFVVEQGTGDTLLLRKFAMGYDVKALYDASTGQLTIPAAQPISATTTAGDRIYIYRLFTENGGTKYDSNPIVGTFDGDKFTFASGVYATTAATGNGGYVWMSELTGRSANGTFKTSQVNYQTLQPTAEYEYPIYVTKTADNQLKIQGLAQWLYSHNYQVPFTITKSTNKASLKSTDSIDWYYGSDSDIRACFYRYRNVDTVNSVSANPSFVVTVDGNISTITSQKVMFEGYQKVGSSGWSGWNFRPWEITIDFNIWDAPVEGVIQVDGINYKVEPETGAAEVQGCISTLTDLNIAPYVEHEGRTYTVTKFKQSAFSGNKTITKVTIPPTVTWIPSLVFNSATNIKELVIPDLKAWCHIKFGGGTGANPLYQVFPTAKDKWGKVYIEGKELGDTLVIPAGVDTIKQYSFFSLRPIKTMIIPEGVTTTEKECFRYCGFSDISLPSTMTSMTASFYNCDSMKSVEVPRSVVTLGKDLFENCKGLTHIGLHTGLKTLAQFCIYGCTALQSLVLPASVDSLGQSPFTSTKNLTELTCRAIEPPVVYNESVFSPFVANCTLYVPIGTVEAYKAAPGWKNFENIKEDTSGVDGITNDDDDVPPVYYNLNGVRVSGNLAPGIYIERRGHKSTKILIP